MPAEPTLQEIQQWMHSFITHDDNAEEHARLSERTAHIIHPSPQLSAQQRIEIYREQYFIRVAVVMSSHFPRVYALLGWPAWYALMQRYVAAYKPDSFNITRVRDKIPEFIQGSGHAKAEYLYDLALMEQAWADIIDDVDVPVMRLPDFEAALQKEELSLVLRPLPALRLLALHHDVRGPSAQRQDNWLVVFRRNFQPMVWPLPLRPYQLLRWLNAGTPIEESFRRMSSKQPQSDPMLSWVRYWVDNGLFAKLD